MWRTILVLLMTLIAVPWLTFNMDTPLSGHQMDVLKMLLWTYGIAAFCTFAVSAITKNYSQVDKLWSVIPIAYVWIVAYHSAFEPRIVLMAGMVTLWGARLTFNFARRGGYSWRFWEGEEDYRWAILRAKPEFQAPWKWFLFNLFFISGYQMGLILLFTLPAVKAMDSVNDLGIWDIVLAALMLGLIIMEFIADQQQYNYQEAKHQLIREGKPLNAYYKVGFTHTGLWAWMRHPNYAAEQSIWVVFYLFSVVATGIPFNWTIAGCLLLILLFKGSSDFSEAVSAEKYPAYKTYQKRVGRFLPFKGKYNH
ncbi:MAG: DUF1295 domain-containing protein [Flavobacteriales bacterium]|nr:DUF1295 domain-containing protein [Flavobacteriales bacterium]